MMNNTGCREIAITRSRFRIHSAKRLGVLTLLWFACHACGWQSRAWAQSISSDFPELNQGVIGILRASKQAVLRPSASGMISKVYVKEGQIVSAQEKLMTFDDRVAQARLKMALSDANENANIQTARIDLEMRRVELERLRRAQQNNSASKFEIERKEAEYNRALAVVDAENSRLEQVQASIALAQAEVDILTLAAPFDAVVIQIHVDEGNSIGPSEPAITIAELNELKTDIYVPMQYFGSMKTNRKYRLIADSPFDTSISATLHHISPVMNSASGCFRCVFVVDNTRLRLPSGVRIRLDTDGLEAVAK